METVVERSLQDNEEVMSVNKMIPEGNDWIIMGIKNSSLYDTMKRISDKLRIQERKLWIK
jgi:hypothetical protein